jgi:acyl-CoA thioesterase-1
MLPVHTNNTENATVQSFQRGAGRKCAAVPDSLHKVASVRRAFTVVVVSAAVGVSVAAGLAVAHHDNVPQAGEIIGYTPAAAPSSAAAPSPLPPLKLPVTQGRALLVSIVGDSLTAGRDASGPTKRFRNLVLAALGSGRTVSAEEATPASAPAASTAVIVPGGMDLVVLELGTSDVAKVAITPFAFGYQALVTSIRASSPHADLVCAGTWSADGAAYDAVVQRICTAAQGRYVPLSGLYAVAGDRGPPGVSGFYGVSDDVAPNDAGHRAIARALLAAVGIALN